MALTCPSCGGRVPGEAVSVVRDVARCPHCHAAFQPSIVLGPRGEPGGAPRSEPPPSEVVHVERTADRGVLVVLPKRGLHGRATSFLFFAVFWDVITIAVSAGFVYAMIQGEAPKLMLLFFVPFYLVGVGLTLWACRLAWGTTVLQLGPDGAVLGKLLFGRARKRTFPLEDLEPFTRETAYQVNEQDVYACTLRAGGRSHRFGHQLADDHQRWLIDELNRVLGELRSGPS